MPPSPPRCSCTLSDKVPAGEPGLYRYCFACRWDRIDTTPKYTVFVEARSDAEAHRIALDQCPFEPSNPSKPNR